MSERAKIEFEATSHTHEALLDAFPDLSGDLLAGIAAACVRHALHLELDRDGVLPEGTSPQAMSTTALDMFREFAQACTVHVGTGRTLPLDADAAAKGRAKRKQLESEARDRRERLEVEMRTLAKAISRAYHWSAFIARNVQSPIDHEVSNRLRALHERLQGRVRLGVLDCAEPLLASEVVKDMSRSMAKQLVYARASVRQEMKIAERTVMIAHRLDDEAHDFELLEDITDCAIDLLRKSAA